MARRVWDAWYPCAGGTAIALFWDYRALWWGCTWARFAGPGLRPGVEIHVCVVPTLMLRARVGWPYRRK